MNDKILKLLPFAGGLLIALGILKVSIYYGYFNIPVLSYLSVTDVLMLFLNDINIVLTVVLIGIMHFYISEEIYEELGDSTLDYFVLKFKKWYVLFFGLGTIIFSVLLIFNIVRIDIWNIYILIFFSVQFITFLFLKRSINKETGKVEAIIKRKKIVSLLSILLIIGLIPLIAVKDIRDIHNSKDKVVLHFSNGKTLSNSTAKLYLGKAGSYHFFYNCPKLKATILKDSDVDKINYYNR